MDRTEGLEKQNNGFNFHTMGINDSPHELIENYKEIPAEECPWPHLVELFT